MSSPLPDRELQTTSTQERRHLDRSLVSGFAWAAAAKWGVQAVSWISLIILARLLSASDFGLLGMTTVFLGLAGTISECGMDGAVILAPEFPESKASQMNSVAGALGLCGCTASLIASPILAGFFHSAQLKQILPVMSVGLILSSLKVVPQALLLRELRFRSVSIAEAAQGLAQSLITVFLAWRGFGYWALVFGGLTGSAVGLSIVLVLRPCRFAWPDWRHLRHDLNFGGQLLVSRIAWYLYSNSDFVVAGRLLGAGALGVYTLAWNIANVPVEKVTALLSRVTPSIFSKVQADSAEIRRYLRLLTEGLCLVIVPLGTGIALVSGDLTAALFDARWRGAATPLCLLGLYAVVRCPMVLLPPCLSVTGEIRFVVLQTFLYLVLLPPSFVFASRWGGAGIAAAWLVVYPLASILLVYRTLRRVEMSLAEYLGAVRPAATACALMVLVVLTLRHLTPGLANAYARLAVQVLGGAAAYSTVLLLFFRERVTLFMRTAMQLRRTRQA